MKNENKKFFKKASTAALAAAMVLGTTATVPMMPDNSTALSGMVADAVTSSGFTYTVRSDGKITITGLTTTSSTVVFPAEIDGLKVAEIADRAFYGNTTMETAKITSGPTSIGKYAFSGCTKLKTVYLPESASTIQTGTFSRCSNLETVKFPSTIVNIESYVFKDCTKLSSLSFAYMLKSVGANAFENCTALTSVSLSSGVTNIEARAFLNCTSLKTIKIPESVTYIGEKALGYTNETTKTANFGITGRRVTAAETYAIKNGIPFTDPNDVVNGCYLDTLNVVAHTSYKVYLSASKGNAPYTYSVDELYPGQTTYVNLGSNISDKSYVSYVTDTPGNHKVRVGVKDSIGRVTYKEFNVTVYEPMTNTGYVDKPTSTVGQSVKVNAYHEGGLGTVQSQIECMTPGSSTYSTIKPYSDSTPFVFYKVTAAGQYQFRITEKDATGTERVKIVTTTVSPALINNSYASRSSLTLGQSATIYGSASGGKEGYTYSYSYKLSDASSYTLISDFSSTKSVTFKPTTAGTYSIQTVVKDSNGATTTKQITVSVASSLINMATISKTELTVGQSATINGLVAGGRSSFSYKYYYKLSSASTWTPLSASTTSGTATFTPSAAGTYDIKVSVTDANGAQADKQITGINVASALVNNSYMSALNLTLGQEAKINVNATGGKAPYTYSLALLNTSVSSSPSYANYTNQTGTKQVPFKPTASGKYTITATVTDSNGASQQKTFTVNVATAISNTSWLTTSNITLGQSTNVTASATGGTGTFTYAVYYKLNSSSTWTTLSDYSKTTSVNFTPASAGTYNVRVCAKDTNGMIVEKVMDVTVNSELKNTSTISRTNLTQSQTTYIYASASGGRSGYSYSVDYKKSSDSAWTNLQSFGSNSTISFTPSAYGLYTVKVTAKDANGKTAESTFSLTVSEKLKNTSTLSKDDITLGQSVTVTASAAAGRPQYTNAMYYRKSGTSSWTTLKSSNSTTQATFTPSEDGEYEVRVTVQDANNYSVSKDMTLYVFSKPVNNTTLSALNITLSQSSTLKFAAEKGKGPYTYAAYYKPAAISTWTQLKGFTSAATADFRPDYDGTYNVKSIAMDSNGVTTEKIFTVVVSPALKNNSTISATKLTLGQSATVKTAATGGKTAYTYSVQYNLYGTSVWENAELNADGTFTFKPTAAGSYTVRAAVTDANGCQVLQNFSVRVSSKLINHSHVSSTSIKLGEKSTITLSASGGESPYSYAVCYKLKSASGWTQLKSFDTNTSVDFMPTAEGTYIVKTTVRDANMADVDKDFTIEVTKKSLENTSIVAPETIKLGESVTVNASAKGGNAGYKYTVLYRTKPDGKWITVQKYDTNDVIKFTPQTAGKIEVCVKVKDADGTEVKKYADVTVTQALDNTSTLSSLSVDLGSSITIKASATGGTPAYTYAVYYKKTTDSKWATLQKFSDNDKIIFKPSKPVSYDVCVKVQDSEGNIVKKYFAVEANSSLKNTSKPESLNVAPKQKVVINASAAGGKGSYKFAAYYKKQSDTKWAEIQNFTANTNITFTPAKEVAYDVCVKVKDEAGNIVKAYFVINVVNNVVNTSEMESEDILKGEEAIVKCSATGGKGNYQYKVVYKKSTDQGWALVQDYSENSVVKFKPMKAPVYNVRVIARDANGAESEKELIVNVG